jgi:hypothetical protein
MSIKQIYTCIFLALCSFWALVGLIVLGASQ